MLMLSGLNSVMKHVSELANWLMEGKGKLHKVLGITCELFGHAEKATEDWDQSLASLLEKLEVLTYDCNKPSFCTHPGAQLCPSGVPVTLLCCAAWQMASPSASLPVCSSLPCLRLH